MQSILQQITAIDGVIGCSLFNEQGKLLASTCPPILDNKQLEAAAGTILDSMHALQSARTMLGMDLRFTEGRLLVRPVGGVFLNVLCAKNVNMSMVTITLHLALRKLEQVLEKSGGAQAAPAVAPATGTDGMVLRIAHLQEGEVSSSFDQLGMVAITQTTAKYMLDFFGKVAKKVKLTTAAGLGGVYPVMIINDVEMQYDQALVVGPGIERKLKVAEGDKVTVALA